MNYGLYIAGYGRHGKDTAGEILLDRFGFTFASSSEYMAPWIFADVMKGQYESLQACFNDRLNRRDEWFQAISRFNRADPTRLSRQIFGANDIYVGPRNRVEVEAMRMRPGWRVFVLWIDASRRLPPEPDSSMTLTIDDADAIVNNNGNEFDLQRRLFQFGSIYQGYLATQEQRG